MTRGDLDEGVDRVAERRSGVDVLATVGVGLLAVAVGTSAWNAVALGPVKLTHAALAGACVALGLVALLRSQVVWAPLWVWVLGGGIATTTAVSVLLPPDPAYMVSRYVEGVPDALAHLDALGASSLGAGLAWLVAAVALPLAVCLAVPGRARLVALLADVWTAGAAVSAVAAFSDLMEWTRIGQIVAGGAYWGGRQAGLAVHPNHLALAVVIALPLVVWRVARARRWVDALWPLLAAAAMVGGLLAAGSRAGLAGAVVVVLGALVVEPRTRGLLIRLGIGAVVLAAIALVAMPWLTGWVASWFRLDGSGGSGESDRIRSGLAAQAWADFLHSPVHGVGLEVLVQGHNIVLQALAAGGVVLLVCYGLAQVGFLLDTWSVDDGGTGLGRALVVCGSAFVMMGMLSNQIADVFVLVPFALGAGLCASATRSPSPTTGPPVHEPVPSTVGKGAGS